MKIPFLAFGMAIGWATAALAQYLPPAPTVTGMAVPVWPEGKMPGHGADGAEGPFAPETEDVLKLTNVSQPTLNIFRAPGVAKPVPAMIICPGGSYAYLSYDMEGTEIAAWLNSLGITGIVLKYRVPNNREGAFQDIQRSMRLVRLHAAQWGIQPDKIGAIGFSAGGHLVARLSANFRRAAYPAIDRADRLSCRPSFVILAYPGYLAVDGKIAPEVAIHPTTPATLLVHTEDDVNLVPGTKLYDAALTAGHISHAFLLYATGGHGYGLRSDKDVKVWPTEAAAWLRHIGVL